MGVQRGLPLLSEALERYRAGDAAGAAAACREVVKREPGETRAWRLLALSLLANGQPAEAREAALRGLKARPADPDLLQALATSHARRGDFAEALDAAERGLAARPDDAPLLATKADALFRTGDFQGAAAALAPALERGERHVSLALAFAQVCPRLGRQTEGVAYLREALEGEGLTAGQRVSALFAMGELLDSAGDYDAAFGAYSRAQALKGVRPDAEEYFASLERMLGAWTAERARAVPRASERDETPVFIVGMPRSGTSLTEQILASHPRIFGAGERETIGRLVAQLERGRGAGWHLEHPEALAPRGMERMGRAALRELRALSSGAARITDKNPVNYLHLGLIAALFPGARVLHCVRDPVDTCLSSYFHDLAGPHMMAGDLALMGRWYAAYQRTMAHWKAVLDLPILEVVYEEMVADQEGVTRRIVGFLGLEWRDEMLRFHETRRATLTPSVDQVRRPMYTASVGRWRNYERHLGPLREGLQR